MLELPLANSFTDHLSAWGAVLGALGTVTAVLIALYRDTWRAARRRPKLSLSLAGSPEQPVTIEQDARDMPGVRLQATNAAGRDTANDVEVLLTAWEHGRGPMTDQNPLVWAHEYESGQDVTRINIPPGVSRQLEFIRFGRMSDLRGVVEGRKRPSDLPAPQQAAIPLPSEWQWRDYRMCAVLIAPPFDGTKRHILSVSTLGGAYHFRLVVTARNADAVSYDATLELDAVWEGEDREAAMVVFDLEWQGPDQIKSEIAPLGQD